MGSPDDTAGTSSRRAHRSSSLPRLSTRGPQRYFCERPDTAAGRTRRSALRRLYHLTRLDVTLRAPAVALRKQAEAVRSEPATREQLALLHARLIARFDVEVTAFAGR
jgi:hypothetical protein